jgi:hypothetical protein
MSLEAELAINRRNTLRFIAARPLVLELVPSVTNRTETGGVALSDAPTRDAQTLRLIEQASAYGNSPGLLPAQDGKQRRVRFQLLGAYDSTIAVGDHWIDTNGVRFEVVELLPFNGYERRGQVVRYG